MKGKIKHRFLAIALCIAMIVTSVNLTNLFDNNFNAVTENDGIYILLYRKYRNMGGS